jgi:hypothetical protein
VAYTYIWQMARKHANTRSKHLIEASHEAGFTRTV